MTVHIINMTYVMYDGRKHVRRTKNLANFKIKVIGDMFVYKIILAEYCYIKEVTKCEMGLI
jgi:hypothetical protein